MAFFQRPAKHDDGYDSEDERRQRKKCRRELNLGVSLASSSMGIPPKTLPELAKSVAATFPLSGGDHCSPSRTPGVKRALKAFQEVGVSWVSRGVRSGFGLVLADEMGLGKTTQGICAFLAACANEKSITGIDAPKLLVVAPLSVIPSWLEEFNDVVDIPSTGLVVRRYGGARDDRDAFISAVERTIPTPPRGARDDVAIAIYRQSHFDVLVTTPEYLLSDRWFLAHLHFDMIIFDEAHRLKNSQSKLYEDLLQSYLPHIPKRLLLTGTPLSNSPLELWNLLRLVNPALFSGCSALNGIDAVTGEEFSRASVERLLNDNSEQALALRSLADILLLRRLKADVLQGLPSITEVVLRVPLSPLQLSLYSGILKNDVNLLGSIMHTGGGAAPKLSLLNTVMQLRKCCNHPYMFTGVEPEPFVVGEHLVLNSGKMVLLDKLLSTLQQEGHRVLLFSQYTYALDIIQDYLDYRCWSFVRLDGSVRGEDREAAVKDFQGTKGHVPIKDKENPFVFLLSTRAGGVGLTLTAADTVIFFDSDWNPQMDLQAQQRAHRIGQTRNVTVYRLCTSNTVEEGILAVASKKRKLASDYIEHSLTEDGEGAAGKLSAGELKDMVRLAVVRLPKAAAEQSGDASAAEARWAAFAANLSIAELLSEARSACHVDLEKSLKNDVEQQAFQDSLEALRKEAVSRARAEPRQQSHEGKDLEDVAAAQRKRTTESERLLKMQKLWGKSAYVTTGLPLAPDAYDASYPNDDGSVCRTIMENALLHHASAACGVPVGESLEKVFSSNGILVKRNLGETTIVAPSSPPGEGPAEDDDDEAAQEEESSIAPVLHVRGDVFSPISDTNERPLRLTIVPVNNSGVWGTGRFFSAALMAAPNTAAQYAKAKENGDLRLGDAHLMWAPGDPFGVQVVLAVIQRSSTAGRATGGDVDLKALELVMRRVETYARMCTNQWKLTQSCTLHFPLFTALSKEASYALDKILAKHNGGSWKRCYMYHASSRHGGTAVVSQIDSGRENRGRSPPHLQVQEPPSQPPAVFLRLPSSNWSLASAARTSIFMLALSEASATRLPLVRTILAVGGVFASIPEATRYLCGGEDPSSFVVIVESSPLSDKEERQQCVGMDAELARFVHQYPSIRVVSEQWLTEHP